MPAPTIRTATAADEAAAVAVVTLGFSADPIARWSWPDPAVYLDAFPRFVRAFPVMTPMLRRPRRAGGA